MLPFRNAVMVRGGDAQAGRIRDGQSTSGRGLTCARALWCGLVRRISLLEPQARRQ